LAKLHNVRIDEPNAADSEPMLALTARKDRIVKKLLVLFLTLSTLILFFTAVALAEEEPAVSELENEMVTGLPKLIGRNLFAAGFSVRYQPLFEPDTPLAEMLDERVVDHNNHLISVYLSPHKIPELAIPLFEPLKIVAADYVRENNGVTLKLKFPNGKEAVTFVDHTHLEKQLQAHQLSCLSWN
jgi:hypothetical protein